MGWGGEGQRRATWEGLGTTLDLAPHRPRALRPTPRPPWKVTASLKPVISQESPRRTQGSHKPNQTSKYPNVSLFIFSNVSLLERRTVPHTQATASTAPPQIPHAAPGAHPGLAPSRPALGAACRLVITAQMPVSSLGGTL